MGKIMLVEDSPVVVRVLSELLSSCGHAVEAVTTPFGATNRIRQAAPDVLLMDLGLPGLNGDTLLQLLRQQGARCKVILVSSEEECRLREMVRAGLVDDYFVKGDDLSTLLQKVDCHLRPPAQRGSHLHLLRSGDAAPGEPVL